MSVGAVGAPGGGLCSIGGGCALDGRRICFRPLVETGVGFEYYLKYTTAHRILSRTRLTGFDTIYFGPGSEFSFTLANRYEDLRGSLRANFSYRIVVFDHRDGASYRLRYRQNGLLSDWAQFAVRSTLVSTPSSGSFSDPVLEILEGSSWTSYTGDWALYAGYIGETGETTVELRMRTASERLGPSSPKYFDQIYFAGAEEGMRLELDKSCSLTPRFLSGPGFGEQIRFADVAQHRIRQVELLEALAQMFNLRFYTEEAAKRVWIEPSDDLFGAGPEADWSARTDFSQGVERRDHAFDIHERRTWSYQDGDGAVNRYDAENGGTFGAWSADCTSTAALQGEQTIRNPLFYPTIDSVGHSSMPPRRCCPRSATATTWRRTARTSRRASSATSGCTPCPMASGGDTPRTRPPIRSWPSTSRATTRRSPSRSASRTATAHRGFTATTTVRRGARRSANASPSRCASPPESMPRSSHPAPEVPRSARSSASTRAAAWCGPCCGAWASTTRRRGWRAVNSTGWRRTPYDTHR